MAEISAVARELRTARENLGLTREQLAEKIAYTASYIEKIETGKVAATEPFIEAAAKVLRDGIDAAGLFGRLRVDERREVVPDWFRPWVDHEQEATEIRWFEPLVVPGLCQTEGYATALLGDAERVAARLERQGVLERATLTVIIDEWVLRRRIGDAETMANQLDALLSAKAAVQVLPPTAATYLGVDGSFALATIDGAEVAYADSPIQGRVTTDSGVIWAARQRWDVLRGESLPLSLSRELIMKEANRWRSES